VRVMQDWWIESGPARVDPDSIHRQISLISPLTYTFGRVRRLTRGPRGRPAHMLFLPPSDATPSRYSWAWSRCKSRVGVFIPLRFIVRAMPRAGARTPNMFPTCAAMSKWCRSRSRLSWPSYKTRWLPRSVDMRKMRTRQQKARTLGST